LSAAVDEFGREVIPDRQDLIAEPIVNAKLDCASEMLARATR
jgi:hypothetical protein